MNILLELYIHKPNFSKGILTYRISTNNDTILDAESTPLNNSSAAQTKQTNTEFELVSDVRILSISTKSSNEEGDDSDSVSRKIKKKKGKLGSEDIIRNAIRNKNKLIEYINEMRLPVKFSLSLIMSFIFCSIWLWCHILYLLAQCRNLPADY